jgi:DNA polymerase III delta subunit
MGITSNESKQRWNASHYSQVKVSVPQGLAESFKAKCKADNVSVASKIIQFMASEVGGGFQSKPPTDPYSTRPKRRKALQAQIEKLSAIMEAERSYMENIPENLKGSTFSEAAEQTVSAIEEALDLLAEAY